MPSAPDRTPPVLHLRGTVVIDDTAEVPAAARQEAARGDGWVKLVADWIDRDLGPAGDLRPLSPDDVPVDTVAAAHRYGRAGHGPHVLDRGARPPARGGRGLPRARHRRDARADRRHRGGRHPRHRNPAAGRSGRGDRCERGSLHTLRGPDAGGMLPHGSIAAETRELVRAGIPARDVVAAASRRTRTWLGVPGLQEGASADLVVYPADPRRDIAVLAAPGRVVLRDVMVR